MSLRSRALVLPRIVFGLGLLVFAPAASAADKAPKAAPKAAPAAKPAPPAANSDAENVKGLSKYMEAVLKGSGKYVARDFAGALDTYRNAILLSPKAPLAHYLVAETQIAMGNLPEAEASLKQADALSEERDAGMRAKVLFLEADLRERQKKWDDAKAAWQAYGEFALKHNDVAFPTSATSRVQAIDDMLKQDKAYEAVRQRIAQEKAEKEKPAAPAAPAKK